MDHRKEQCTETGLVQQYWLICLVIMAGLTPFCGKGQEKEAT